MDIRHTRDVDLVFQRAGRLPAPEDGRWLAEDLVMEIANTGRTGETVAWRGLRECGASGELVQAFYRRRAMPGPRALAGADAGRDQPGMVDAEQAAAAARTVADELGQRFFGTEHLLIALIRDERGGAARVLRGLGVEPQLLAGRLARLAPAAAASDYALLKRFGRDLVAGARDTTSPAPSEGLRPEVERVIRIASRRTQNNVLVFGAPPADPRAVVLELARAIAAGELAGRLACERLYEVDMQAVLAGSPAGEALRGAVRAIGQAARNRGDVLLCIADIDRYLRREAEVTGPGTEEALRIAIARGHLQVLGTATDEAAAREILDNRPVGFRTQLVRLQPTAEDRSGDEYWVGPDRQRDGAAGGQ